MHVILPAPSLPDNYSAAFRFGAPSRVCTAGAGTSNRRHQAAYSGAKSGPHGGGFCLVRPHRHGDAAVVPDRLGQHLGVPMEPAYASAIGAVENEIDHDAGRGDASF